MPDVRSCRPLSGAGSVEECPPLSVKTLDGSWLDLVTPARWV